MYILHVIGKFLQLEMILILLVTYSDENYEFFLWHKKSCVNYFFVVCTTCVYSNENIGLRKFPSSVMYGTALVHVHVTTC